MRLKTTKGDRVNIIKSIAPVWKKVGFLVGRNRKGQEVEHIQQSMHTNTMVRHLLPGDVQAVVRHSRCHLGNLIKLLVG